MKFLNLFHLFTRQSHGGFVVFERVALLFIVLPLIGPVGGIAKAQQFQISAYSMGYLGWDGFMMVITVENDSPSNVISSFTISNIYSVFPPQAQLIGLGWNYFVDQNPSNSVLWDLTETNDYECSECFQGIETNGGTYITSVTTTHSNGELVFGMTSASAAFGGSGGVQGNPSALLVPVGWQSGPFEMNLQPTETNGLFIVSWAGADGSIYVEHEFGLGETNWQVLARPVSGGSVPITASGGATNEFFRLRLGP